MAKTAFLFPGQGAQTVGMGRGWADSTPSIGELYQRANHVLGYDLASICFEGPADKLNSTIYSQPALFVTSVAALESVRIAQPELADTCAASAGLSLGEYTALHFAGSVSFEDGLRLVQERGRAMQAAADRTPSGMVAVLGLELAQIEELCQQAGQGEIIQVANLLCPGNIVVSGSKGACERIVQLAPAAGAMKAVPLTVAGAFHSPIMQPAVESLTAALANASITGPRIPVIFNVDAQPHRDPADIRSLLARQLTSPVRWEESMRNLLSDGFDTFYEVGPGRVLQGLMKRIDRSAKVHAVAA
jgi:[acyl-carrier-protein] S-malonyltransferase